MIINRKNTAEDPVAEWFYDFCVAGMEVVDDLINDKEKITMRFESLYKVLKVLKKHKLFSPTKILLSGVPKSKYDSNPEDFYLSINDNVKIDELENFIKKETKKIYNEDFVFSDIHFFGNSTIFEQGKEIVYNNAFFIYFDYNLIEIKTDIDAWIPYNLKGIEQKETYRANAPRLEKTLQEMENELGFETMFSDNKYTRINKFKLYNWIDDATGKPRNVWDNPVRGYFD